MLNNVKNELLCANKNANLLEKISLIGTEDNSLGRKWILIFNFFVKQLIVRTYHLACFNKHVIKPDFQAVGQLHDNSTAVLRM